MRWISKTRNVLFFIGLAGIISARGQVTLEERTAYIISVVSMLLAFILFFFEDKKPILKKQKKIEW